MTTDIMTNNLASEYDLEAGVPLYLPGVEGATIHVKTGTTANVYTTLSSPADIAAETADWFPWTEGAKAGPYIGKTVGKANAIKITSAAGGTVYVAR